MENRSDYCTMRFVDIRLSDMNNTIMSISHCLDNDIDTMFLVLILLTIARNPLNTKFQQDKSENATLQFHTVGVKLT